MGDRLEQARQRARDHALNIAAATLREWANAHRKEKEEALVDPLHHQLLDLACLDLADELEALARHDTEALNQLADRLEATQRELEARAKAHGDMG